MKVGDLVVHRNSWLGYLFIITQVDEWGSSGKWVRCTIVRTPDPEAEYEVGYTIRWKRNTEWKLYKK